MARGTRRMEILTVVREANTPLSSRQVAAASELSPHAARYHLTRLVKTQAITRWKGTPEGERRWTWIYGMVLPRDYQLLPTDRVVLAVITKAPGYVDALGITAALGMKSKTVRNILSRLARVGAVQRKRVGRKGRRGWQWRYWCGPEPEVETEEKAAPFYNSPLWPLFWGDVREAIIDNWGRWGRVVGAAR